MHPAAGLGQHRSPPLEMSAADFPKVLGDFVAATKRAVTAGMITDPAQAEAFSKPAGRNGSS